MEEAHSSGRRSAEANYAGGSGTMQLAGGGSSQPRSRDASTSVLHPSIDFATCPHLTHPESPKAVRVCGCQSQLGRTGDAQVIAQQLYLRNNVLAPKVLLCFCFI